MNIIIIIIIIIFPPPAKSQIFPLAKPNCVDHCGKIIIPYPAGTTPDCYLNPLFWVTCNHAFNPPKLFYQNYTDSEITDISLDGQAKIMQSISRDCYARNGTRVYYNIPWTSLSPLITVNNTANKFTIVGCDAEASVLGLRRNGRKFRTGCSATCGTEDDLTEGSCMGLGCCQTSIPADVTELEFELRSYSNYSDVWDFNNCSHAFLVEETAFAFSRENLTNLIDVEELPIVVDWTVGNGTCAEAKAKEAGEDYACVSPHSGCYDPPAGYGYRCRCYDGYQGNPYLTNGCQDIDECAEASLNDCAKKARCTNTAGNYTCSCLKGYSGNGRGKDHGCLKGDSDTTTHYILIGQGGFGTVYKAELSDKSIVAVKKPKRVDPNQIEQFINEVFVLSQVNHRNVVRLLGCCLETEVPLLVYEFISNGALSAHLHDKAKARLLNWETRLKIGAETAGVLAYLHSAASTPIIHRDVKPDNILLDQDFTSKVSDFGASKLVPLDLTQLSTMVQGTLGYLDPEYMQTSQLTEKSDVYSFGVVLVELLTGRKAISFDKVEEERNLSNFFLYILKQNRLSEILDGNIAHEGNMEKIAQVASLAKGCLNVRGEDRPTMKEVATELEGLIHGGKQYLWSRNEDEEIVCLLTEVNHYANGEGNSAIVGYDSLGVDSLMLSGGR